VKLNKRKKTILIITCVFVAFVVLLLFFSSTIYNFRLPQVTVAFPGTNGVIVNTVTGSGTVELGDSQSSFAGMDGIITIYGKIGDIIPAGQPLYKITPENTDDKTAPTPGPLTIEQADLQIKAIQLQIDGIDAQIVDAQKKLALDKQSSGVDTPDVAALEFQLTQKQEERDQAVTAFNQQVADQLAALDNQRAALSLDIKQTQQAKENAQDEFYNDLTQTDAQTAQQVEKDKQAQQDAYNAAIANLQTALAGYQLSLQSLQLDLDQLQKQYDDVKKNGRYTLSQLNGPDSPLLPIQYDIDQKKLSMQQVQVNIDKANADISDNQAKIDALNAPAPLPTIGPVFDSNTYDAQIAKDTLQMDQLNQNYSALQAQQPDLSSQDAAIAALQFQIDQALQAASSNANSAIAADSENLTNLQNQKAQLDNNLQIAQNAKEILVTPDETASQEDQPVIVFAQTDVVLVSLATETGAYILKYAKVLETAQANTGYQVKITLPFTAQKLFDGQDLPSISVIVPSKNVSDQNAKLVSLTMDSGGLKAVVSFQGTGLSGDEPATLTIQTSVPVNFTLPNSAIHSSGDGNYYILSVQQQKSSIGYDYVLVSIPVLADWVTDSDAGETGLSYVPSGIVAVVNSDRPVTDGMHVRLADGSDYAATR